jgi:hypothetical protein
MSTEYKLCLSRCVNCPLSYVYGRVAALKSPPSRNCPSFCVFRYPRRFDGPSAFLLQAVIVLGPLLRIKVWNR